MDEAVKIAVRDIVVKAVTTAVEVAGEMAIPTAATKAPAAPAVADEVTVLSAKVLVG